MRVNRVLALTASAALAFGLAACSSDSDKDKDSSSAGTSQEATKKEAADKGGSGSGDFCAAAVKASESFDPAALQNGDPDALHKVADAYREVAKGADGDAATAWGKYADYIDLSADMIADPTNTDNQQKIMAMAEDSATWGTAIAESLATCS